MGLWNIKFSINSGYFMIFGMMTERLWKTEISQNSQGVARPLSWDKPLTGA